MRVTLALLALLPLVLGAKELPGEELPSKASPGEVDDVEEAPASLVKRSISDIAARRRSALDKTFMRFGRSDPGMANQARIKMSGNLMRFGRSKADDFLRPARAKSQDFMRFGRAPGNLMRFGRSNGNLMRFGRGNGNLMRFGRSNGNLMRFGRSNGNLMRFGRSNGNLMRFGRAGNLMRFGRSNGNLMRFGRAGNLMRFGRANNNLMRFGRADDDFLNYENEDFNEEDEDAVEDDRDKQNKALRMERSVKDVDGNNDNFMRLGRSLLDKAMEEQDSGEQQEDNNSLENGNAEARTNNIKAPIYFDDKFLHFIKDSTDVPEINERPAEESTFDLLFPEESRRKRSLSSERDAKFHADPEKHNQIHAAGFSDRISPKKTTSCAS